jgi:hypothetical protein
LLQDLSSIKLSKLSVDDIIEILNHVKEIMPAMEQLSGVLKQNAISGRVLVHCELSELKSVNFYLKKKTTDGRKKL